MKVPEKAGLFLKLQVPKSDSKISKEVRVTGRPTDRWIGEETETWRRLFETDRQGNTRTLCQIHTGTEAERQVFAKVERGELKAR